MRDEISTLFENLTLRSRFARNGVSKGEVFEKSPRSFETPSLRSGSSG
jgi:hypothetical protein